MRRNNRAVVLIIILITMGLIAFILATFVLKNKKSGLEDVSNEFTKILSEDDAKKVTNELVSEYLKNNYQGEINIISIKSLENKVEATVEYTSNKKTKKMDVIIINKDNKWIIYKTNEKD